MEVHNKYIAEVQTIAPGDGEGGFKANGKRSSSTEKEWTNSLTTELKRIL